MAYSGRFNGETPHPMIRPKTSNDAIVGESANIVSALQIGHSNRRKILQTLFDEGATSRADLARIFGAKRTTISGIVQPLIDAGLLVEESPTQTGGVGKPARPLWFSADQGPVCAVMLMSGLVQTAMVSLRGEIYGQRSELVGESLSDRQRCLAAVERCIAGSLSEARGSALGIGIAVDGMVDPDAGSIVAMTQAPRLAGLDLTKSLSQRFGIATIIDHHPRAILMGERWFGKGRRLKDFAVIYADEGLACSLFLNGEPFRGPHGSGGELGHTIVVARGDVCTCGRRGCWETIATLSWLRKRAAELGLNDPGSLDVPRLCRVAETEHPARDLLREYAYNLAIGIANLQTLLMPSNFIVYGNAAGGSERLLSLVRAFVDELTFGHPAESIEITFGEPEQQSVALRGAAGLVIADELRIRY